MNEKIKIEQEIALLSKQTNKLSTASCVTYIIMVIQCWLYAVVYITIQDMGWNTKPILWYFIITTALLFVTWYLLLSKYCKNHDKLLNRQIDLIHLSRHQSES